MLAHSLEKSSYLESHEREARWVNVGEPPITGLRAKGQEERKLVCEDVKIHDPQRGLFLVADGVSRGEGWFASRETAETTNEELGKKLDDELDRIRHAKNQDATHTQQLMDAHIRAQIKMAVLKADRKIKIRVRTGSAMGNSSTTLSLGKLVELPDGEQYLYFTNVGDSRIFLARNGVLKCLTIDDSFLGEALQSKAVSEQEAKVIDQTDSPDSLTEAQYYYFRHRNMLTRVVGGLKVEDDSIQVNRISVRAGDRLMFASDGLTDQKKETDMLRTLLQHKEDRAAERSLQQEANEMALKGTDPRAKADDIAVIVRTIEARGPNHSLLREVSKQNEPVVSKEQHEAWRADIAPLKQAIEQLELALSAIAIGSREYFPKMVELTKKKELLRRTEHWVAKLDSLV